MMDESEMRKRAAKIAEDKVGFQIHLAIYSAVNIFLIALWYVTLPPGGAVTFPWFVFPLFGWGIGVTAHFVAAYRGEGYVQRVAEREFDRLKNRVS